MRRAAVLLVLALGACAPPEPVTVRWVGCDGGEQRAWARVAAAQGAVLEETAAPWLYVACAQPTPAGAWGGAAGSAPTGVYAVAARRADAPSDDAYARAADLQLARALAWRAGQLPLGAPVRFDTPWQ